MLDFVVFLIFVGALFFYFSGARREAALLFQGWSYSLAVAFVVTDLSRGGMEDVWFLAELLFIAVTICLLIFVAPTNEPPPPARQTR